MSEFKVGDKVVEKKEKSICMVDFEHDAVHKVLATDMTEHGQSINLDGMHENLYVLSSDFELATPEEIKAGHRIDHFVDANNMVDLETLRDCDTSPNCKKFDERVK